MAKQDHLQPSFDDTADWDNATRGFISKLSPCIIESKSQGKKTVAWDNDQYAFLNSECPSTADPKLWRQSQLNVQQGLFEVTPGIYQVRGFDISNISFVEGKEGVIVLDPLISNECAKAALDLYWEHRGKRPVTGLVYSHSHVDHFGGALGVLPGGYDGEDGARSIPIIAPEGFMEEVLSESIIAGPAMRRRAVYMYGILLPRNAEGQIGCGLGMATSRGTTSLIPPNRLISKTAEELVVDGVRIVFQSVPDTEAPAEINCWFPDFKALFIAECATHGMHNIITLRGTLVRDAKGWSKHLDETLALFGDQSDVLFAGHNWPTWGTDSIKQLVAEQRDMYAYLHDQTVRMMNLGYTGIEIAEVLRLPPKLQRSWHTQGFYGSVSHNVKGIYQRYMTWFDGNPTNLWRHPPAEEGRRYVSCMGGVDEVISKAKQFASDGDLRFAATLLDHAVAAEPTSKEAKTALANVFEKLGFGAENATWRNFYLTGSQVLRAGKKPLAPQKALGSLSRGERPSMGGMASVNPDASIENWLDALSVQFDGVRAGSDEVAFAVDFTVPEEKRCYRVRVSNGAMTYRMMADEQGQYGTEAAGTTVSLKVLLNKAELYRLFASGDIGAATKQDEASKMILLQLLDLLGIAVNDGKPRL